MKKLLIAALALPFPAFAHITGEPHAETPHHILATAQAHPFETVLMLVAAAGIGYMIHRMFNGR
ncbi:hypothetical protein RN22_14295 [Grimontia sp. AD028]|uniref:Uncharacterized protein n=1 Tax=Grimontia sedimenti TaxID=2711294 RepID=A0A6M1RAU1_9GAMM|nr:MULTISPECIES: hypothetical protein [Grimontia]KKD59779.1 hypothetical protein RN22_14295 [Grimontia sp. AD028]NGN96552.1 hypothetical protein [Grimontia sedimenti]